MGMGMMVLLQ